MVVSLDKKHSEDIFLAPHDEVSITLKVSVFGRLKLDFTPLVNDSIPVLTDSDDLPF